MAQKLKTFEVDVQETSYGAVRVQAASKADAIEKAQEALAEGEVMWGGKMDHQVGDVREVKAKRSRKAGAR